MNLKEASESKRRMRRPGFPQGMWYSWRYYYQWEMERSDGQSYTPDQQDAFADDWELEPLLFLHLSEEQIRQALMSAPMEVKWSGPVGGPAGYYPSQLTVDNIITKLGF